MWSLVKPITGITNTVIIPTDGMITVSKPDSIEVIAYVDKILTTPVDNFWGPAGKPVYFEIRDSSGVTGTVTIKYGDTVSTIEVPEAIKATEPNYLTNKKEIKMAEILNPAGMMMSGGGDGGLGFGSGGGLIGGLILGSLLRNGGGGGGLFGGGADGGGAAAVTGQATANMQLMQSIGAVDKSVAVNAAMFEASQATQSLGLTNQFNATTGSLASRVDGVKDSVNANAMVLAQQLNQVNTNMLQGFNETQKVVVADGTATRALITSQYELNLQRQLADANAAIIELRGDSRLAERTRGIEISTTNNINQNQLQQQQQQQLAQIGANIAALYQQNQHIQQGVLNIGSGTVSGNSQTAANTRVS
jgi:hypothetical protein